MGSSPETFLCNTEIIYCSNISEGTQPRSQGFFLFVTRQEKEKALGTRLEGTAFFKVLQKSTLRVNVKLVLVLRP